MTIRHVRFLLLLITLAGIQQAPRLSAQLPTQFEGVGWLTAYGAGASTTGALGVVSDVVSPPIAIPFDDISDVAIGAGHTLMVRRNGSVWATGANNRGQLGLGFSGEPIQSPTQIPSLVDIVYVAAGGDSSYAIDSGGVLWAWGDDSSGQLGIGNPGGATMQAMPRMNPIVQATDVAAGDGFAIATDGSGTLWSWGSNELLQLGTPGPARNQPQAVPVPGGFFAGEVAAAGHTVLARSGADVLGWGSNTAQQIADSGAAIPVDGSLLVSGARAIAVGNRHILIALENGSVIARGANEAGQLGAGTFATQSGFSTVAGLNDVVAVAAGDAHSLAVTSSRITYAWGANDHRQLMIPTAGPLATPTRTLDLPTTTRDVRARGNTTIALNDPGTLLVSHNIETYPTELPCGQAFNTRLSITGFNGSGGQVNNIGPGLHDLVLSLNLTDAFQRAGSISADIGSVATSGSQITWTLPSLAADSATLSLQIYPVGPEGEFPVFDPFTYVSSEHPAPFAARIPYAFHRACPAVVLDQTPPSITSITPSPATLSPPNHQMLPVTLGVTATDDVSVPVCSITGVTSNEQPGPGETDWSITGPLTLRLRSERNGSGSGRVYSVEVRCVDDAGNAATASTVVLVPKAKKK